MSGEQRTPASDPSGEAPGGGPAQPAQEPTASKWKNFGQRVVLAVIGGVATGIAEYAIEAIARVIF